MEFRGFEYRSIPKIWTNFCISFLDLEEPLWGHVMRRNHRAEPSFLSSSRDSSQAASPYASWRNKFINFLYFLGCTNKMTQWRIVSQNIIFRTVSTRNIRISMRNRILSIITWEPFSSRHAATPMPTQFGIHTTVRSSIIGSSCLSATPHEQCHWRQTPPNG